VGLSGYMPHLFLRFDDDVVYTLMTWLLRLRLSTVCRRNIDGCLIFSRYIIICLAAAGRKNRILGRPIFRYKVFVSCHVPTASSVVFKSP
jgi:hypothetical protein